VVYLFVIMWMLVFDFVFEVGYFLYEVFIWVFMCYYGCLFSDVCCCLFCMFCDFELLCLSDVYF